jgi:SAM-dependent methyltransferase
LQPSPWVVKYADLIPAGAKVLDLACGNGRHSKFFIKKSCRVTAVDIDIRPLDALSEHPNCKIIKADLESQDEWILASDFDAVIVTNYLHRPLFRYLPMALAPNGILIYQTFMVGNEKYGKPSNPDYLLAKGELKTAFDKHFDIIEFSQGFSAKPKDAVTQQICARLVSPTIFID